MIDVPDNPYLHRSLRRRRTQMEHPFAHENATMDKSDLFEGCESVYSSQELSARSLMS